MNTVNDFVKALAGRENEHAVIDVPSLVFSEEFGRSCKICVNYNTRWNCPPADAMEEHRKKISQWQKAFVFSTKHELKSPFDFGGMFLQGMMAHRELSSALGVQFPEHLVYSAGPCNACKTCAYPAAPCRFPQKSLPSIESAGISVTELSRTARMTYNNGDTTVTFFTMILFNEANHDPQ
jgi:predicted metal-binding protein